MDKPSSCFTPNIGSPQVIGDQRYEVAENPLWHEEQQCLYWTDIPAGSVYRFAPSTGIVERIYQGLVVGGFTIQIDGSLLLFMAGGAIAKWNGGKFVTIVDGIPEEQDSRFNDVIADPNGGVFCGTMATKHGPGRLYHLNTEGQLLKLLDGVECSNGMAFSIDRKCLFHTDSFCRTISRFSYSESSGTISDRESFIQTAGADGYPDGLVRDSAGNLWSAMWGGGCIVRYSPDGTEIGRITLPAKYVTSMAFGGDTLCDLFVTTARQPEDARLSATSGAVLRLKTNVRGGPEFRSCIRA